MALYCSELEFLFAFPSRRLHSPVGGTLKKATTQSQRSNILNMHTYANIASVVAFQHVNETVLVGEGAVDSRNEDRKDIRKNSKK